MNKQKRHAKRKRNEKRKQNNKKKEEIKQVAPVLESVACSSKDDSKERLKKLTVEALEKENELLINKLTTVYKNSSLDFKKVISNMVGRGVREVWDDIRKVYDVAHENVTALRTYKDLRCELEGLYNTALEVKNKQAAEIQADINETRNNCDLKLLKINEEIKISEENITVYNECDRVTRATTTIEEVNEKLRQTNAEYTTKVKELAKKISIYKNISEIKNFRKEIALEQERASELIRTVAKVRAEAIETRKELNETKQKNIKMGQEIVEVKNEMNKLDKYLNTQKKLKVPYHVKAKPISHMDDCLSNPDLTELQKQHDSLVAKVEKAKEEIRQSKLEMSKVSQMFAAEKENIGTSKEENIKVFSKIMKQKKTISDQQAKLNELKITLTDSNTAKQKIKNKLQAELRVATKKYNDMYQLKLKEYEAIEARNKKIQEELTKKEEEMLKFSLELEELNKFNAKTEKNEKKIKKEIKRLEKMYVQEKNIDKGI